MRDDDFLFFLSHQVQEQAGPLPLSSSPYEPKDRVITCLFPLFPPSSLRNDAFSVFPLSRAKGGTPLHECGLSFFLLSSLIDSFRLFSSLFLSFSSKLARSESTRALSFLFLLLRSKRGIDFTYIISFLLLFSHGAQARALDRGSILSPFPFPLSRVKADGSRPPLPSPATVRRGASAASTAL